MNIVFKAVNIHKTYCGEKILDGISLTAKKGEIITLLGPSGAGKSTFLRCCNLLETPEIGNISLAGEAITWKNKKKLRTTADSKQLRRHRRQTAMVFQQFNLWSHKTVIENITLAPYHVLKLPKQLVHQYAESLLKKVGLSEKAHCYPQQLSGGQQQRVAIARALAMRPKVILFDEPTASLDPEMVQGVLSTIKDLATEGLTMIIATHEMQFAEQVADKVLFMERGKVVAEGSPKSLFKDGENNRFNQFVNKLGA